MNEHYPWQRSSVLSMSDARIGLHDNVALGTTVTSSSTALIQLQQCLLSVVSWTRTVPAGGAIIWPVVEGIGSQRRSRNETGQMRNNDIHANSLSTRRVNSQMDHILFTSELDKGQMASCIYLLWHSVRQSSNCNNIENCTSFWPKNQSCQIGTSGHPSRKEELRWQLLGVVIRRYFTHLRTLNQGWMTEDVWCCLLHCYLGNKQWCINGGNDCMIQ